MMRHCRYGAGDHTSVLFLSIFVVYYLCVAQGDENAFLLPGSISDLEAERTRLGWTTAWRKCFNTRGKGPRVPGWAVSLAGRKLYCTRTLEPARRAERRRWRFPNKPLADRKRRHRDIKT